MELLGYVFRFWNKYGKYGTRSGLTFHLNIAAMFPDNFVAAGEAQPRSRAALAAYEGMGKLGDNILGYTDAGI